MNARDFHKIANQHKSQQWAAVSKEMGLWVVNESKKIPGCNDRIDNISEYLIDDGYVSFDIGWAVHCTLRIDVNKHHIQEDGGNRRLVYVEIKTYVSWSSSHRSVAQALASVDLYRQVTTLAAMIESRYQHRYLLEIWENENDNPEKRATNG